MNDLTRLLGLRGHVGIDSIESAALRGNALGDPSTRPLAVYTPPGYDAEGSARYPVLYCMHGYTGNVGALVATRPWETNVVQWCDRLIAAGTMPPVMLVIVDGFTRLGGSQYVDSVHNGNYATYVIAEVIPQIDATYRTIANDGGRAIFGKSTGGFASMHLSMAYPGVFGAFASHSGDSYFRYAFPMSFPAAQRSLERFGSIEAFVTAFEQLPKKPQAFMQTIEILGQAAAYSPAAAERFAIDLPFDLHSGEIRDDVFARWLAFDPVERVTNSAPALAPMRLRYLDCGRRDEYGLDIGARMFTQRARDAGLTIHHEEFDDDHRNVGYRYEVSLPLLARALERA